MAVLEKAAVVPNPWAEIVIIKSPLSAKEGSQKTALPREDPAKEPCSYNVLRALSF
jgi:hypothetical protein